jgi:hypothetical protein
MEDITDRPDSVGEEEGTEATEAGTSVAGQKRKTPDSMEITLPFLPDIVITVDDMLGKVPKMRYVDHDMRDATKFPELVEENYLINMGEIGPLGRPMLEPAVDHGALQLRDYESLRHTTFGHGKNVRPMCQTTSLPCPWRHPMDG